MSGASDEAIGWRTLTKAAWRLLPLVGLGYGVSFMDRVNIGFAALQMNRDLHFNASIYGLGAGLFFLSYAAFETPSNLLLVRIGPRRWLARIMVTWGLLSSGMMFVRTPAEFYAVRLLLGFAEAGFFPGVVYYLGQWFPASHRARAISRFYVAAPLSTVVMGALAGSLLGLQGRLGLAGWQWLFLAEGAPAVVLALAFLLFLPESPGEARWLAPRERDWLVARLAAETAARGEPGGGGLLATFTDRRVLALGGANFVILGGYYCFSLSAPAYLHETIGLDVAGVGALTAAGGLLAAGAMILWGWRSDRTSERFLHLGAPLALMAVAFAVLSQTSAPIVVAIAFLGAVAGNGAVGGVFWAASGDLLHPRQAAVGVAAINTIGQVGSFILPVLWGVSRDRTGGFRAGLTLLPLGFAAATALILWLRRDTRRKTPSLSRFVAPPS
jgi:ACS family tartrate transporter-like MFS transporter